MRKILTLIITLAFFGLTMNRACAQPVTLDPTFGDNGMTVIPNTKVEPHDQPLLTFDNFGNIIAVVKTYDGGFLSIIKTNADGVIDLNFGTNGVVKVPVSYFYSFPDGLKITKENKILLNCWKMLTQFNEDGSVDESFGENGKIIHNVHSTVVNLENDDYFLIGSNDFSVSKYDYNGVIDKNFGVDGKIVLKDSDYNIFPCCIKILKDQSIIVAGTQLDHGELNVEVAFCKLNANGKLASDFANNGIWKKRMRPDDFNDLYNEAFLDVIEETNGNLILTCYGWYELMCSFYPDGTVNKDFGEDGFYYYDFDDYDNEFHKILPYGNKYITKFNRKRIICIDSNGNLDTSFNNGGSFIGDSYNSFVDIKLQKDNKLIFGGASNDEFTIGRLNLPPATSIKQFPYIDNSIVVYPNPTTGELNIQSSGFKVQSVEVYDVYGRKLSSHHLITSSSYHKINISYLQSGIYFVKISTEKGEVVKKVVKQ